MSLRHRYLEAPAVSEENKPLDMDLAAEIHEFHECSLSHRHLEPDLNPAVSGMIETQKRLREQHLRGI